MSSVPEHSLSPTLQHDSAAAQAPHRARVLDRTDLQQSAMAYELEGHNYGEVGASVIVVDFLSASPLTNALEVIEAQPGLQR